MPSLIVIKIFSVQNVKKKTTVQVLIKVVIQILLNVNLVEMDVNMVKFVILQLIIVFNVTQVIQYIVKALKFAIIKIFVMMEV